ncbi:MAG: hypothetical protein LUO94_04015 [Methylococcaceae bacterium]|nr:hypothetical protein [Methylococcaceae bacterium]
MKMWQIDARRYAATYGTVNAECLGLLYGKCRGGWVKINHQVNYWGISLK